MNEQSNTDFNIAVANVILSYGRGAKEVLLEVYDLMIKLNSGAVLVLGNASNGD